MNSEPWRDPLQELWQQQPVPAPLRIEERVLRDVRTAEEEWNREWSATDRSFVVCALLMGAPELMRLTFGSGLDWSGGTAVCAVWWWWAGVALTFGWRRRRIERAYDQTLLERIARARRVLRERMIFNDASMLVLPVMPLLVGVTLLDMTDGSMVVAVLGGVTALIVLTWLFVVQRRKQRAQFGQRLTVLDEMRAQLCPEDPNGRRY